LSIDGPEAAKNAIRAEMDRVRQHAMTRGLTTTGKIPRVRAIAHGNGVSP
jgi:hypothetical protein